MKRGRKWGRHLSPSRASRSVCVCEGSSEEMRRTYMKSAQEGATLICHTKPAECECAMLLLAPSPPPPPPPLRWHLHVPFMPSIFRLIPNLIAVSLLLPAAAAPKIKSSPREGDAWLIFSDRPNVALLKELRSPIRSGKTTADVQMLNFKYDYIDWAAGTSLH